LLRAGVCISFSLSITNFKLIKLFKSNWLYRRIELKMRRKIVRRRVIRSGLLLSNIFILLLVTIFVLQSSKPQVSATPAILHNTQAAANLNPVDQLSSANIALTVSRLNSLPETTAITNQAQTQQADMAISSSDGNVLSKPQVVNTQNKSKDDIKSYTVLEGDTFASLAVKFGVTSDSIKWSNATLAYSLAVGNVLVIPPVNGLVYTAKVGDTVDSLATKFKANKDSIISDNNTELAGMQPGEQILIRNGSQVALTTYYGYGYSSSWGGPSYGSNGYDYGYCTWYVADNVNVPSNWGNASSWAYYARLSGWSVTSVPTAGAIAQTPYAAFGLGHVAVVRKVNPDGTIIVSEMNQVRWNVEDTRTIAASEFPNYISH